MRRKPGAGSSSVHKQVSVLSESWQNVAKDSALDLSTTATVSGRLTVDSAPNAYHIIPELQNPPPPSIPMRDAFAALVRFSERVLTPHEEQMKKGIRSAFQQSQPANIRSLFSERFTDIDSLLFRGELVGKVSVFWETLREDRVGSTTYESLLDVDRRNKTVVRLGESLIDGTAVEPDQVWGTFFHELIHAYSLIMSDELEECSCGQEVMHGPGFEDVAKALVQVLEIDTISMESLETYGRNCHAEADEKRLKALEEARAKEFDEDESLAGLRAWTMGYGYSVIDPNVEYSQR